MALHRIGGSFAPPLSDETLAAYKTMIDAQPASAVKDALNTLHRCVAAWWDLPESAGSTTRHPTGVASVVPLDASVRQSLWDLIPWPEELVMIQTICDRIADKELRHCAFHLLWHVKELDLDREPLTNDKLNVSA